MSTLRFVKKQNKAIFCLILTGMGLDFKMFTIATRILRVNWLG